MRRASWRSAWGFQSAPSAQFAGVTQWWNDYALQNTAPAVALDFVNNRYFNGADPCPLSSLVANSPVITAGGMLCNAGNFDCQGALLAALQNASATVIVETSNGAAGNLGLVDFTNSGDTPLITNNAAGLNTVDAFVNSGGHAVRSNYTTVDWSIVQRVGSAWGGGSIGVIARGSGGVASMAFSFAAVTQARIGSYAGSFLFNGLIRRVVVYASKLSSNSLLLGTSPTTLYLPLKQRAVQFADPLSYLIPNDGHALGFEFNQPWTIMAEITGVTLNAVANVIFTNVAAGPPWTGYEVFMFPSGTIRSRLMSNWDGVAGHPGIIEVQGSTNLGADTRRRIVAMTYDGSGLASGIKFYLDGVAEALTTVENSLTGSVVSGADLYIGNQVGGGLNLNAFSFKSLVISNIARSPTYLITAVTSGRMPAVDSNTKLEYLFTEGSGTTVADTSGNGFHGTITGTPGWY